MEKQLTELEKLKLKGHKSLIEQLIEECENDTETECVQLTEEEQIEEDKFLKKFRKNFL